LVKGDQSDNINLRDNDVIRIPAYSQRVTLSGEVKRPGIFEMKAGETFSDSSFFHPPICTTLLPERLYLFLLLISGLTTKA
jgi:hypothetical protein